MIYILSNSRLGERPLRSSRPGTACGCVSPSEPACASTPLAACFCSLPMADLRCSASPRLAPPAAEAPPAPPPRCDACFGDGGAPQGPYDRLLRPLEPHSGSEATAPPSGDSTGSVPSSVLYY
jgi:hypothetical protein